jgi:hypothetical protein
VVSGAYFNSQKDNSFRIRILDPEKIIPDPGGKKALDPRLRVLGPEPQHYEIKQIFLGFGRRVVTDVCPHAAVLGNQETRSLLYIIH